MKHTPTPWKFASEQAGIGTMITGPSGQYIGEGMTADDAAYTYSCVNCFELLLAAVRKAEDLLTRCEVDPDPNIAAMQATDIEWDAVHAQLREAIAMASATTTAVA